MSNWKKLYLNPTSGENHSRRALEDHIRASLINNTPQDQYIFLVQCADIPTFYCSHQTHGLGFVFICCNKIKHLNQKQATEIEQCDTMGT